MPHVYPTAGELQRMSFYAKDRLRRRLTTRPPEDDDAPRSQAARKPAADLSDKYIAECHARFNRGDITPAVETGEREYQRRSGIRRRAEARARTAGLPRVPKRGPEASWDVDRAIGLRERGLTWGEIATLVGTTENTARRGAKRELERRAEEEAA